MAMADISIDMDKNNSLSKELRWFCATMEE